MMYRNKLQVWIFFLIGIGLLQACMPEVRYAREYVRQQPETLLMVMGPAQMFLSFYPEHPDYYPPDSLPDLDLEQSRLLAQLDTRQLMDDYMRNLRYDLKALGFRVLDENQMDLFLASEGEKFVFQVVQLEVVEYRQTVMEKALFDTILYYQEFDLTRLLWNSWIEYSAADQDDIVAKVLFSDFGASDRYDGRFRYHWIREEVRYEYDFFPLRTDDVYGLGRFAGSQNAAYIHRFLMNTYVANQMQRKGRTARPLHYDPLRKQFLRIPHPGFIILEP